MASDDGGGVGPRADRALIRALLGGQRVRPSCRARPAVRAVFVAGAAHVCILSCERRPGTRRPRMCFERRAAVYQRRDNHGYGRHEIRTNHDLESKASGSPTSTSRSRPLPTPDVCFTPASRLPRSWFACIVWAMSARPCGQNLPCEPRAILVLGTMRTSVPSRP